MREQKFFRCNHCGNVITKLVDSSVPVVCCGERMEELKANTTEASVEKHLPVVEQMGNGVFTVKVGGVPHPMTADHHIAFIYVQTAGGGLVAYLADKPEATFCRCAEEPTAVYEYCNLHGLWKIEL